MANGISAPSSNGSTGFSAPATTLAPSSTATTSTPVLFEAAETAGCVASGFAGSIFA